MANQLDIVENLNGSTRKAYPFLIILQHDRTAAVETVVVAPLIKHTAALSGIRLHPAVNLGEQTYLVLVEQLAAIPRHLAGRKVGSAAQQRYDMIAALNPRFTGI